MVEVAVVLNDSDILLATARWWHQDDWRGLPV